jgi:hypothetical protein
MYAGPYAGFNYPRLAVRDFVAMMMAYFFKIDVPTKLDRTAAEWKSLRDKVRKAWEREQKAGTPAKPK